VPADERSVTSLVVADAAVSAWLRSQDHMNPLPPMAANDPKQLSARARATPAIRP